ncbi:MAG: sulfate reduction electron transfer complex DsrMKJOP subunit DsrO [Chloroflexota bacterium]
MESKNNEDSQELKSSLNRRDFLKVMAAALAALAGIRFRQNSVLASSPKGSNIHKWGMVIDQAKCTGCGYCTRSCQAHNNIPPTIYWNQVLSVGEVNGKEVFLPRPCQHCTNAPCVEVCPVNASYYRADGIVMMNYDRCIGCRYCEIACPYSARAFNWEAFTGENPVVPEWGHPEVERRPRGVVEKCSFCYQRIDRGLANNLVPGVDPEATPACVVACPVEARAFGDLNNPESRVSRLLAENAWIRLREDLGTETHVYYLPPRKEVMG